MVSKKALFGGALVAILALAGCTATPAPDESANPEAGGTYTIYLNTPLTGALSNVAKLNVATLQYAVKEINENEGGILGKQIELIVADDQLDTTRAVTLLQEQIDKKKPDLVFFGATSNTALALLPLLTRNQIISTGLVQSSAVNDPDAYPYAFVPYVESKADAAALLVQIQDKGYQKVAILTANDANGQSAAAGMSKIFTARGLDVVAETYTPTDIDMTAQLQRLQDAKPDVLVIQAFGAATSHILESRTKLGWDIPTLGHSALGLGQNLAQISTEKDWNNMELGVFDVTAGTSKENLDVLKALVKGVKAEGDPLTQSLHYVTVYWDVLHLIKQGVEQAGTLDADKVKAALENLGDAPDIADKLVTFPVEYERWAPDSHFFEIPGDVVLTYVKPGPLVDGVIQSIK